MTMIGSPAGLLCEPSGDTSGAADRASVNRMLAAGQPVFLRPGPRPYYIDAPIRPVTGSFITGFQYWGASQDDYYGAGSGQPGGTRIVAVPGFTGAAMIDLADPGSGQAYGADISAVTLDGTAAPRTSAMAGFHAAGAWGACFLRGVFAHKPPGDCFRFDVGATGRVPDDWFITGCKGSGSRTGHGFNIANNMPDSWISDCEMSEMQAGDGWRVGWCNNTRWSGCKGENNAGRGWHFTGISAAPAMLTACSSQLNQQDGFLFDDSGSSSGTGTYLLTGCRSAHDGLAGGTYAGFRSAGSSARVMGAGCYSAGAPYGAYAGGGGHGMCFTGSYLAGTVAAAYDDGSNANVLAIQEGVPF